MTGRSRGDAAELGHARLPCLDRLLYDATDAQEGARLGGHAYRLAEVGRALQHLARVRVRVRVRNRVRVRAGARVRALAPLREASSAALATAWVRVKVRVRVGARLGLGLGLEC